MIQIPWEERPAGNREIVWRSAKNPIITREVVPCANSVLNSAVVPFGDGFAGVFRVDNKARQLRLHSGKSADGFTWELSE